MALKGAGGRWHADDDMERAASAEADAALAPPSGLSAIEVICFGVVIGLLFFLARELTSRGVNPSMFQGMRPERHVFLNLAVSVGAFFFGLSGTQVPRQARIAGAMLSAVVSVAMLYVLLFLGQSLYVTGACISIAAGSALCSRTGLPRDQGYPAALIAAAVMMIAYAGTAWALR